MQPLRSWPSLLAKLALLCLLVAQRGPLARSALVGRSSESVAALLASGRQSQPVSYVSPEQQQQQQQVGGAQQRDSAAPVMPLLSAIQTQAQRVLASAPNLTHIGAGSAGQQVGNVLEVLSNVGKAIQQQIMSGPIAAGPSNRFVQIVSPQGANSEPANSKKNEYQAIVVNEGQQFNSGDKAAGSQLQPAGALLLNATQPNQGHREQSEQLRQEIVRRASQLQQVVASSMEVLKNNGDLIVRRLLEQLNSRLDQAKSKADKIINEPATTDVAIKALHTINSGLNNLNNIITNIVNRLDISSKDGQLQPLAATGVTGGSTQRVASNANALFEAARSRLNLHQLGQQFQSALSAVQQQQRPQFTQPNQQPKYPTLTGDINAKTSLTPQ